MQARAAAEQAQRERERHARAQAIAVRFDQTVKLAESLFLGRQEATTLALDGATDAQVHRAAARRLDLVYERRTSRGA